MALDLDGILARRRLGRVMRRFSRVADKATDLPAKELRIANEQARALQAEIARMQVSTEKALLQHSWRDDGIERPEQCDWTYRPEAWIDPMTPRGQVEVVSPQKLIGGMSLFHDCQRSEISYRQRPNSGAQYASAYGLELEVYRFDGSFLSLVQDLPHDGLVGLNRGHFISLTMHADMDREIELYARLNVQHGPNTEQMVRQMSRNDRKFTAEFDLAYSKINEKRLEKMWLDLIFEGPQMNRVVMWDMTLTRAPRADL